MVSRQSLRQAENEHGRARSDSPGYGYRGDSRSCAMEPAVVVQASLDVVLAVLLPVVRVVFLRHMAAHLFEGSASSRSHADGDAEHLALVCGRTRKSRVGSGGE